MVAGVSTCRTGLPHEEELTNAMIETTLAAATSAPTAFSFKSLKHPFFRS
jgi:hypothetical protein